MPTTSKKLPRFGLSRRGWILLAAAGIVLSSTAADAVASSGRVRAGVNVAGLELGGKTFERAEELLTQRSRRIATEPAPFTADGTTLSVTPEQVGFFPDVDATLQRARRAGRTGHVLARVWQAMRSYFASSDVGWSSVIDRESAGKVVEGWAEKFDTDGREAGITAAADGTIQPVDPIPGRSLDRERAMRSLVRGLETWPRDAVRLPFEVKGRRTDASDAQAAAERAAALVAEPITLLSPSGGAELSPADLAKLVEAVPRKGRRDWGLQVRFSPGLVAQHLGERMKEFERESKDATFAVSGATVSVRPGQNGLKFDAEKTAEALDAVAATAPPRSTDAAFTTVEPSVTTEAAEKLNIHELVSTYTTRHPAGQPRVKNIHIIAERVDGLLVRPGETFSLNKRAGERTAARGYVLAPMIYDGEYRDEVGGGVSQFATTMFNAVFFGGYKFETYKAHSYYISRYPAGREATVSWPAPDLKWTNNRSSGVLVKTSYSSTSITVSLYGDKGGLRVDSRSDERTNPKPFEDKRVEDPTLPPGTEKVTQNGADGFDIVVWRIVTEAGGKSRRERFFTRYKPQPRIISVGPGSPAPSPTPGDSSGPTPEPPRTPAPPPTPAPSPRSSASPRPPL